MVYQIQSQKTLDSISPQEFELLVLEAFARQGYKVEHTPWSGDEGIDGFLIKSGGKTAVQCKKYKIKGKIGQPELRDFLGAMVHHSCSDGIYVCTSGYSDQAIEFAKQHKIQLFDYNQILRLFRSTINDDYVLKGRRVVQFPPNR